MKIDKYEIIKNHCYTDLVYQRINKKLGVAFSRYKSQALIKKVLEDTALNNYKKLGKNFYISNLEHNIKITVNSNTFRIITVDRIIKE
ncbi:DUF3781 domain-containing protein [Tenacibaculum ovolyticum]|uniref:DUF3781 domain-containing protein n=1 Tax=Tenacibaculum ovolyticum TaxID=104270 RepID=UPI0018D29514|nr:DUF3781 domain-containing protein [Tenacibaculum ovolyticum]WBX76094.1 DUF3781 domain-containing protein [Tenacibaculum ovolyticum]